MYVTLLYFRLSPNIFLKIFPSFVIHNVLTTSHLKTHCNVKIFSVLSILLLRKRRYTYENTVLQG